MQWEGPTQVALSSSAGADHSKVATPRLCPLFALDLVSLWACAPVHWGGYLSCSKARVPPPPGGERCGSDCRCTVPRKGAISQSPARLPLVPSALGGQTLPEALGSDVNIPYPKPQRAGVGGKRRGTIHAGFPVQQRPPPCDLQAAEASSCLRDRTDWDTTIQAFAWLETHHQVNSTWQASHCEAT